MVNLALAWAEAYTTRHPGVSIAVTGGGSGTGIAALTNGTVDVANASREMKSEEIAEARGKGVEPVQHVVARDAIAVVIHPDNPVDELTIPQLAAIFTGEIINWQEVGGEDRPIVLLSRESNSGTYAYFLEQVVRQGDKENQALFSPDTLLMPSSEGISNEVRHNPNAIGYDGLGYVTPDQKMLAVARGEGRPYVRPSVEAVNNAAYAIARPLYMYTNGQPTGVIHDYLEWIMGPEGQHVVQDLGFIPLQQGDGEDVSKMRSSLRCRQRDFAVDMGQRGLATGPHLLSRARMAGANLGPPQYLEGRMLASGGDG